MASKFLSHLRRRSLFAASRRLQLFAPALCQTPPSLAALDSSLRSAQSPFHFIRHLSVGSPGEDPGNCRLDDPATPTSELDEFAGEIVSGDGPILPVKALISLLDCCHDLTGFPWWAVIASSTIAMRIMLLPVAVLQQKKMAEIAEFMPKLPPPIPPLFSGKSYLDHFHNFNKERLSSGCPSLLWILATPAVQIPFFVLWMVTTRRMSVANHPGFDCGGILWFQNLTEVPLGTIGLILPLLIGGLHFINVQVAFAKFRKYPSTINIIARGYKWLLQLLSFPIIYGSCLLPQACLIYWATNLSSSILVQVGLRHPVIRTKLGLPKETSLPERNSNINMEVTSTAVSCDSKGRRISVEDLSPKELLALSVQVISQGENINAISLLELALEKDPEYVRAMVILGQTLLKIDEPEEAAAYLESAISKLFDAGNPTEKEDDNLDLLIMASQWAGVAYIRQSKWVEGLLHLERIVTLKEPEDPKIKAHYYDGLILLSSALSNKGRLDEAAKYLRLAAAYDPKYNELLEQCEKELLDNSRKTGENEMVERR